MRVPADLRGQARRHAVVFLPQRQAVLLGKTHQVLAVFSSRRLSVGWAMALGMTVESTMTRSTLAESMTATRRATSIVCCSSSSTPPSPMHFLQAGQARRIQRQLRLQVGVDAEVLPVRVLDPRLGDGFVGGRKNVCCRYSRPATSRGRNAGRPTPDVKWAAKPDLICDQSMSDARRTSGWRMSICSSSRERNNSAVCGNTGFGHLEHLVEFARKQPPGGICLENSMPKTSQKRGRVNGLRDVQFRLGRVFYASLVVIVEALGVLQAETARPTESQWATKPRGNGTAALGFASAMAVG